MSRRILNLGCGTRPRKPSADWPEVVNLDLLPLPGVDVVFDLNRRPWPFADEEFDSVEADSVLEHLDDVVGTMEEIHRVLKSKRDTGEPGLACITVPLAGSPNHHIDPTHKRGFTDQSFDFFDPESVFGKNGKHYSWARFKLWKLWVGVEGPQERVEVYRPLPLPLRYATEGVDLRFELVKLPADEEVRELRRITHQSASVHSYAHVRKD